MYNSAPVGAKDGTSNLAKVVRYIHNQEMHHRKMSFEEEYLGLLRKHGVDFDPRFVFD